MQEILIKVHGSSFVYNRTRNMVGYFVQVGTGNEDPALTTTHLNEKKRLPYTAPPTGLALMKVQYNESELDQRMIIMMLQRFNTGRRRKVYIYSGSSFAYIYTLLKFVKHIYI